MVLAGDVELQTDGTGRVASQRHGQTVYHVVNGECSCKDYPKAPQSMCKHRIAYGLHKRARTLMTQRLAQLDSTGNGQRTEQASKAEALATPLPEAPASANVHVMLGGRKVQVTLRDVDETRLLARLEALLKRFPSGEEPREQAPPLVQGGPAEGWCTKHSVQMKRRTGEHGSWYSHKTNQGWCKGK